MRTLSLAASLACLLTACASSTAPVTPAQASTSTPACRPGDALLNATLWAETAAEHDALTRQVYATAGRRLDAAIADPSWSALPSQTAASSAGLPPAVILDLDETAIDNMAFEARAIRAGVTYSQDLWNAWTSEAAAGAIPGAREFLAYAASRGVTPFYITNREASEKDATRRNLERLGFPLSGSEDTLIVRGERPEWDTSDKTGRREFVAAHHRVLMLFGDDLNDFTFAAGKSRAERDALVQQYQSWWGERWFILPDAAYGSWEQAAMAGAKGATDCEKKVNQLH